MRLFRSRARPWPVRPTPKTPLLNGPPLSVVVICIEMAAQIEDDLHTLLPPYQQEIDSHQYEVVLIDNGTAKPVPITTWSQADNVRYVHVKKSSASVNPGVAANWAVAGNRSPMLCLMINGMRVLTPRVLRWGIDLAMLSQDTLVDVRSWERAQPLDELDWEENPYSLFQTSTPCASAPRGFIGAASECSCLFLSRALFDRIGGFDQRYNHPGGGLCNTDFFYRAVAASNRVFTLLGEGSFHPAHEIVRNEQSQLVIQRHRKEYEKFSRRWKPIPVSYDPVLAGHVPAECRRWLNG